LDPALPKVLAIGFNILSKQYQQSLNDGSAAVAKGVVLGGFQMAKQVHSEVYMNLFAQMMAVADAQICDKSNINASQFEKTDHTILMNAQNLSEMGPTMGPILQELQVSIVLPRLFPSLFNKPRAKHKNKTQNLLLFSPPGFGKTFAIQSILKYLIVALPSSTFTLRVVNASSIKDAYVGVTEKNIDRLYTEAGADVVNKENDKSVIFLDEADSLVSSRDNNAGGSSNNANIVNMFLQTLDGLKSQDGVITIFATNYPWMLDNAILSRFESQIGLDVPNDEIRRERILTEIKTRTGCESECTSISTELNNLVAYMGMNTRAPSAIAAYFKNMKNNTRASTENYWIKKFAKGGQTLKNEAVSTFGFSQRDIGNFLKAFLQQVVMFKLTSNIETWRSDDTSGDGDDLDLDETELRECRMIPLDEVTYKRQPDGSGNVACVTTQEERDSLRLYLIDIKKYLAQEGIYQLLFEKFPAKLTEEDYIYYLYYSKTTQQPLKMERFQHV
jgi:hypothetical protein